MAYLVGAFLVHCRGEEAEVFMLFANVMHQNHFPTFLAGRTADFKYRLTLFD